MKHIRIAHIFAAVLVSAAFLLTACGGASQNAKFYTLSSIAAPEPARATVSQEVLVIAVGPLRIPEYLDRPQIITRTGPNELYFSEFQRWGGSLENELRRVVAQNIGSILGGGYTVVNWPSSGDGNFPVLYRVAVDILQFEGGPGNTVTLKSQWGIIGKNEQERLMIHTSSVTEPAAGSDYDAVVAAMSRAAAALSREMADALRRLPAQEKK